MKKYSIGQIYRDKSKKDDPEDQFMNWINLKNSGMLNSPGIRPLNYSSNLKQKGLPAYLILVTNEKTVGTKNPWDDFIDLNSSKIDYWGDAKIRGEDEIDDFKGNQTLRKIYNHVLTQNKTLLPPILHFSKPQKGYIKFNGLCVLEDLKISRFEQEYQFIKNYKAVLTIIDCDDVYVDWLHYRVKCEDEKEINLHENCPDAWIKYLDGQTNKLEVWRKEVKSKEQQLPSNNTFEYEILDQLLKIEHFAFEKIIVNLFKQIGEVVHEVYETRKTNDGGFDFFGSFILPNPINYKIKFRGEVKRYKQNNSVDPKSISRLVARLKRQEYGIFVTTSYFSNQAQKEVLEDDYPIHLISGLDLVNMFKQLGLVTNNQINKKWLDSIIG